MRPSSAAALVAAAMIPGLWGGVRGVAQADASLSGGWTLNRGLSQFPREIGFNAAWAGGAGGAGTDTGTPVTLGPPIPESLEDATRVQRLTAEVRNPPTSLTIADAGSLVAISDSEGHTLAFHADGRTEVTRLGDLRIETTARREGSRLTVVYQVERGRQLRYSYDSTSEPRQLIVEATFVGSGGGDSVRRVYEPGIATSMSAGGLTGSAATALLGGRPLAPPSPPQTPTSQTPQASAAEQGQAAQPASAAPPGFDQRPGAELRGLKRLGVVVEGLGPQATACGLKQPAIEAAMAKALTDAGFTVTRNADEDTYLYVNVGTSSLPGGSCVTRYDAFLYSNTTAPLEYHTAPVLIQAELMHKGGLATGGSAAQHADGVVAGLKEYVAEFVKRIHDANK